VNDSKQVALIKHALVYRQSRKMALKVD